MARSGALLILWGYVKKVVIADNVGVVADKVFSLEAPGVAVLWAGVFAFAIQIYADFSAYSDIARGVGRWLGFDLMRNFDHPYMATGPIDFWRRWHISLSSWFRDYVYIPLGGSRGGEWTVAANLMITFLLSGLWHGAGWNYVMWGGYHGLLVVAAHAIRSLRLPSPGPVLVPFRVAGMFALTMLGWLMFRETNLDMLVRDLNLMPWHSTSVDREVGAYLFLVTVLYSMPLWIESLWSVYVWPAVAPLRAWFSVPSVRLGVEATLAGVAFALILVLHSRQSLDFVYFQF